MTEPERFRDQAAQGDVYFIRIKEIPKTAKAKAFDSSVVIAHSETGHHHSLAKHCGVTYYETADPMVAFLRVEEPSLLEHHRSFDTHAPFIFEPGCYELRRPREYVSADENRRVED